MAATFSGRKHNTMQSILGFCAYVWYYILVFMIMLWIKRHIELQVVIPFNSLLEKIWSLIIDPMVVVSTNQFQKIAGIYSMVRVKQQELLKDSEKALNKSDNRLENVQQRKGKQDQKAVQSLKQ